MIKQSIESTEVSSKVNKETQCSWDIDSLAVDDVGNGPADQVTPMTDDMPIRNDKGESDVITHKDLYQLLALLMQMSDDRSVSRSAIVRTILNHVFKIIDKPQDDIRQAISQSYPSALTGSTADVAVSIAKSGDHRSRKTNSKTKSDLKNMRGTEIGIATCAQ